MANTTRVGYNIYGFSASMAKAGDLCVMVKTSIVPPGPIYNIIEENSSWTNNANLKGAGVAKYRPNGGLFEFTVDGDSYLFTSNGTSAETKSKDWKLMRAVIDETIRPSGSVIAGTNKASGTRNSGADPSYGTISYTGYETIINNLNARDQFAMQALNSIITKMDEDPATLSISTISHYCKQAYIWASGMMTAAADARGDIEDETGGSPSQEITVSTSELGSVEERLLNNLVYAVEKMYRSSESGITLYNIDADLTTTVEGVGKVSLLSELNATLGAIKNKLTDIKNSLDSIATAITNLNT